MIILGANRDEIGRKSKDKIINTEGKKLLEKIEGNIEGDEEEELTYIGARGSSVINHAITNVEMRGKIGKMSIEHKMDSDHLPICVYLQLENERQYEGKSSQNRIGLQQIWTEECIKKFREILETTEFEKVGLKETWQELKEAIRKAT